MAHTRNKAPASWLAACVVNRGRLSAAPAPRSYALTGLNPNLDHPLAKLLPARPAIAESLERQHPFQCACQCYVHETGWLMQSGWIARARFQPALPRSQVSSLQKKRRVRAALTPCMTGFAFAPSRAALELSCHLSTSPFFRPHILLKNQKIVDNYLTAAGEVFREISKSDKGKPL
jgi:hypothetical protein